MKSLFYEEFDFTIFPYNGEIEESQYQVFIVARFQRDGETFKVVTFPTDYNIFCTLLNMVRARAIAFPKLFSQLSNQLVIAVLEDIGYQELCRNILKTVCAFPLASRTQIRHSDQSLAFILNVNVNNPADSLLLGGSSETMIEHLGNVINQQDLNKNEKNEND